MDNVITHNNFTCKACASKIGASKNKLPFNKAIKKVEQLNSEIRLNLEHPITKNEWGKVIDRYWFKCSNCGEWINREYRAFTDRNCNLCGNCSGHHMWDISLAKEKVKELGSNLLDAEWNGVDAKYSFTCVNCGDITNKSFDKFVNSNQRLCDSCVGSKGEISIHMFLKRNNINFIQQYTFDDLRGKNKQYLKFDFGILDNFNKLKLLIEYQGEQHYFPVDFANKGEEWSNNQFKVNKYRDGLKKEYVNNRGIKLLEIPYWDYDNIDEILGGILWEKEKLTNN